MSTSPPIRDDIRDGEIARARQELRNKEIRAAEQEQLAREREAAQRRAAELGLGPPTSLARTVVIRNGAIVVDLVDALPPTVIARVQLSRETARSLELTIGMAQSLRGVFAEAGSIERPESRFWTAPKHDPLGGAPGYVLPPLAPVPGPLFVVDEPVHVEHEPSAEERARATASATATVEALATTKGRARDLAASLREALASGEHAVLALVDALEAYGAPAAPITPPTPPTTNEPPRAA